MKQIPWVAFLVLVTLVCVWGGKADAVRTQGAKQEQKQAVIDIAFCLDTTGSMSGLIEGAKQKIWSIVNTVATAQPKPVLRISLVAYRDQGDDYVTRVFEFTSDLEAMYGQLRGLAAGGGGDTPEHVNKALHETISDLQWSKDPGALKIVYLVGDAPPHMDYQDGFDYRQVSRKAAGKGIIINTIQCGRIEGTREIWQEVARLAEGKYAAIDQSGGMIAVSSPYDKDLTHLSAELNKTYVAYGRTGATKLAAQAANDKDAEVRAPAAAAERASAKAGGLYRNESWDLVDALRNNQVELNELKPTELPKELQGLTPEDQRAYVEQKGKERAQIQQQILELSKKRDAYVQSETKKLGTKSENAFDAQVLTTLQEQGKAKGIQFEK